MIRGAADRSQIQTGIIQKEEQLQREVHWTAMNGESCHGPLLWHLYTAAVKEHFK